MRAVRATWRFLGHPVLSVLGNLSFLLTYGPLVIAGLIAIAGRVLDEPVLFLVAIGLALLGIAVATANTLYKRPPKPMGLGPEDDQLELGEPQGRSPGRVYGGVAIREGMLEVADRDDRQLIIAEFVTMIEEGKKLLESEFTGELTWSHFDPWWKGIMAFVGTVFGDAERQRLIEIEPTGAEPKDRINAVMDWLRERRDHPERWTPKLSGDDLAAALRKRRDAIADPLGDQVDSLMREGIALVTTLSTPAKPEETESGVWKISGGDAPQEWIDLAAGFQQRCRTLLETQRPALLADFRDGHMKHFRLEREANERREQSPAADRRSDSEKMLALADYERSGPRREVEACLEGLAAARKVI